MQTINLDTPTAGHRYTIMVGAGLIANIGELFAFKKYSRVFIVTDDNVGPLYLEKLVQALPIASAYIVLPAGEQAKSLENVSKIWTAMHRAGCDRKALVIALGGGVVGDVAGFAASSYMRGVAYLHVPTTLLSQVDSSIGGKTAIDFDGVKNLIGSFAQPAGVVIDTDTLATLPAREFTGGFGEIIKHGLIRDATYFHRVTSKNPREFSPEELADIITGSCRIKAEVVMSDETEAGPRKLLNFGHTVGHAVEALSLETDKPMLHGEAVSIGMAVEATISERQRLLPEGEAAQVRELLAKAGLPVRVPEFDAGDMLAKMDSDKKNVGGTLRFTLLRGLGEGVWDQVVAREEVEEAIRHQEHK